ncbi:MAG: hypothetical protein N2Z21_07235, partial [Candidatus Sumerlaeaceae bacterium]|nr:hypothetical protein [Candidatus Sumerlaeaceae bacterium]
MAPDKRSFEAAAESKREGISCGVTVASLASIPNLLLYAALAVYCLVAISHWNEGYIDFGDGNYLYISWRMANGAVLYRDVLAPQPPMHFVTGWILAKTAQLLNLPTLPTFRAFSVVLHALTAFLVARLTRLAASGLLSSYQATCAATLGGIFYLLLPIGFWWSSGFQSEPLEIVFLYAALLMLVHGNSTKTAVVGGILAALATLTNMTAAPYAVFFMIYLAVRERHKFAPFVSMFFAVWGSITALLEWKTGAYLENVIFNQVGAFPRKEFLPPGDSLFTYAWHKITSEGRD